MSSQSSRCGRARYFISKQVFILAKDVCSGPWGAARAQGKVGGGRELPKLSCGFLGAAPPLQSRPCRTLQGGSQPPHGAGE